MNEESVQPKNDNSPPQALDQGSYPKAVILFWLCIAPGMFAGTIVIFNIILPANYRIGIEQSESFRWWLAFGSYLVSLCATAICKDSIRVDPFSKYIRGYMTALLGLTIPLLFSGVLFLFGSCIKCINESASLFITCSLIS
jgi:hypothetical protein